MCIKEYTIPSNSKKKDYSVVICLDENNNLTPRSSCDCYFGSFGRFTQKNILLNKWECVHLKIALHKYKNGEKDNIAIAMEEEYERNTKQIYPIF
jgi:hypothetical protein